MQVSFLMLQKILNELFFHGNSMSQCCNNQFSCMLSCKVSYYNCSSTSTPSLHAEEVHDILVAVF